MATYRTIRMDFWNDPYVEGMEPQDKLLYVYLFSSPHTNNLGVLTVSRRLSNGTDGGGRGRWSRRTGAGRQSPD